jgi:hypothetical protein
MNLLIVGDIHGCYYTFKGCLESIKVEALKEDSLGS